MKKNKGLRQAGRRKGDPTRKLISRGAGNNQIFRRNRLTFETSPARGFSMMGPPWKRRKKLQGGAGLQVENLQIIGHVHAVRLGKKGVWHRKKKEVHGWFLDQSAEDRVGRGHRRPKSFGGKPESVPRGRNFPPPKKRREKRRETTISDN